MFGLNASIYDVLVTAAAVIAIVLCVLNKIKLKISKSGVELEPVKIVEARLVDRIPSIDAERNSKIIESFSERKDVIIAKIAKEITDRTAQMVILLKIKDTYMIKVITDKVINIFSDKSLYKKWCSDFKELVIEKIIYFESYTCESFDKKMGLTREKFLELISIILEEQFSFIRNYIIPILEESCYKKIIFYEEVLQYEHLPVEKLEKINSLINKNKDYIKYMNEF